MFTKIDDCGWWPGPWYGHFLHVSKNISAPWFHAHFFMNLYMYIALGQGQTTHYGQNFDVNRKPFVASLRRIFSASDFIYIFSWFNKCIYSCMSGADNPSGQNFNVNRNLLSLWSFATSFKKSLWSLILYSVFHDFIHVYIAPGQGLTTPCGQNFDAKRHILSLRSFVSSWKKISLKSDFILFFHYFIHVYMYIALWQGQTAPRGQSFDVNRNVLSLHSFVASFKNMSLKSDFRQFFSRLNTCI